MMTLLRETSDLLEAAEEVLGCKGAFSSSPLPPLAWAGDPNTPDSVQPAASSSYRPSPQDPREVLLPSSSEPPREALEEGEPGVRSAPTSAPLLSLEEAAVRVPALGEVCPRSRARPQAATLGCCQAGGEVFSAPKLLHLALRTPPQPQIQATTKGSSKQVRSFSPPDQPDAKKSATRVAGFPHPKSLVQIFSPSSSPGPPIPSTSFPPRGPQELAPNTCWGNRPPDHPPESAWVHEDRPRVGGTLNKLRAQTGARTPGSRHHSLPPELRLH